MAIDTPDFASHRHYRLSSGAAQRVMARVLSDSQDNAPDAARFPSIRGYEIFDVIGRGASAAVYVAVRDGSPQPVALKLFHEPLGSGPVTQRAWRELDTLQDLCLPCVPRMLDYGVDDEEHLYIATQYAAGEPLDVYCKSHPLSVERKIQLLIDVATSLQAVHDHGIIHRDIKPNNIVIKPDGTPIIVDFGIAFVTGADPSARVTHEGTPLGTPAFMSPEQAAGRHGDVTVRADVYSLGATAYWMLTGETPIDTSGSYGEAIGRIIHEQPRHLHTIDPDLPSDLAAILWRAVARDPDVRTPSAGALAEDLQAHLRGEPLSWSEPSRLSQLVYWVRTHRALAVLIVIAAIGCIGTVAGITVAVNRSALADERQQLAEERALIIEAWEDWSSGQYEPAVEGVKAVLGLVESVMDPSDPEWADTFTRIEVTRAKLRRLQVRLESEAREVAPESPEED